MNKRGSKPKYDETLDTTLQFRLTTAEKKQIKANARKVKFKSVGRYIVAKCGKEGEG